jgi:hypothetical protein
MTMLDVAIIGEPIPECLPKSVSWQPHEDDILRKLWADGVFASLIAAELDRTKNSIIGRARRLKLEPRVPGWPGNPKKPPKPKQKNREITIMPRRKEEPPELKAEPIKEEAYVEGTGVALLDLEPTQCRWPLNTPPKNDPQYFFCGEPNAGGGLAYCRCHLKRSMSEDAFRRLRIAA